MVSIRNDGEMPVQRHRSLFSALYERDSARGRNGSLSGAQKNLLLHWLGYNPRVGKISNEIAVE